MNNATIFAADRTTHLKIVAISFVASIAVIVVAMMAHAAPTAGVRVAVTHWATPSKPAGPI